MDFGAQHKTRYPEYNRRKSEEQEFVQPLEKFAWRFLKRLTIARQWWHTPLIPEFGSQRQVSSRPAWSTEFQDRLQGNTEKPCLEKPKEEKEIEKTRES